jgi:hypothetical protein
MHPAVVESIAHEMLDGKDTAAAKTVYRKIAARTSAMTIEDLTMQLLDLKRRRKEFDHYGEKEEFERRIVLSELAIRDIE